MISFLVSIPRLRETRVLFISGPSLCLDALSLTLNFIHYLFLCLNSLRSGSAYPANHFTSDFISQCVEFIQIQSLNLSHSHTLPPGKLQDCNFSLGECVLVFVFAVLIRLRSGFRLRVKSTPPV